MHQMTGLMILLFGAFCIQCYEANANPRFIDRDSGRTSPNGGVINRPPFNRPPAAYKGLFLSEREIQSIVRNGKSLKTCKIKSIKRRYPLRGICDSEENNSVHSCPAAKNIFKSRTCCRSVPRVDVLNKLECDGEIYHAVHYPPLSAIVMMYECPRENSPCIHGRCRTQHRLEWVLARKPQNVLHLRFVPVEVPNHCYCSNK